MRKRSKYRPKGVRLDNMTWVQAGLKKLDDLSAGVTLKIRNHDALDCIRRGVATRSEVDAVIDAFNVAEALARRGVGTDWLPEIAKAQDALLSFARRGVERGDKFVVRGEELNAMNLAMQVHDAQLEAVTVKDLEAAMNFVTENIRCKRARQIKPTSGLTEPQSPPTTPSTGVPPSNP
jgi:hypothetical protein